MDKRILFLSTMVVFGLAASAQTEKGDWMVGGNFTIRTNKNNSLVAILPSAGYFFANNFVAGASFNLSFEKTGDAKTNTQSVGPFARYYFNLKSSDFKPFLHAEWNIGNVNTTLPLTKTSNTSSNFLLGAGGAFFINSNVALEGVAGFAHSKVQGQSPENGFAFRVGFQVHLLGSEVERVRAR
jgi:outer membrane protein W